MSGVPLARVVHLHPGMTNQDNQDTQNDNPQTQSLADLENKLKELTAAAKEQAAATKELQEKLRIARGTHNKIKIPAQDLRTRVEEMLSSRPRSQDELAAELSEPVGRIGEVVKEIRPRLKNVGSEDRPAWWLVPGNSAPTAQLNAAVLALMAFRPISYKELVDYTGAKPDRVAGAIGIAVKTKPVLELGTPVSRRWFLVPEGSLGRIAKMAK